MFSISLAIIIVLASATALGLLLVAALGPLRRKTRTVTRSFWCPFREIGPSRQSFGRTRGTGRVWRSTSARCSARPQPSPARSGACI